MTVFRLKFQRTTTFGTSADKNTENKTLIFGNAGGKVGFTLRYRRTRREEETPGEWVKAVSQIHPDKILKMKRRGDLAIILMETVSDTALEEKFDGFFLVWLKVAVPSNRGDRWAFDTSLDELGIGLL